MEPRSGGEATTFHGGGPLWGRPLSVAMEPRSGGEATTFHGGVPSGEDHCQSQWSRAAAARQPRSTEGSPLGKTTVSRNGAAQRRWGNHVPRRGPLWGRPLSVAMEPRSGGGADALLIVASTADQRPLARATSRSA